jgi:diguanylate cyclase (GGDEF)-like protein
MPEPIPSVTRHLHEAPGRLRVLLAALFVIAVILDLFVVALALPRGTPKVSLLVALLTHDALIIAVIYAYTARVLLEPVDEHFSMEQATAQEKSPELDRVMQTLDGMRKQLDAAIADNEDLRAVVGGTKGSTDSLQHRIDAAFAASRDALIHIDAKGAVQNLTAAAGELLQVSPEYARGRPLRTVAQLYDIDKDPKRQRSTEDMALQAVSGQTTSQTLPRTMLVFGAETETLLTTVVVPAVDAKGKLQGAILRLDTRSASAAAAPHATEPEAAKGPTKDPLTGLLNVQAFDARVTELIGIARMNRVSHTLLLLSVDDLDTVHREFGAAGSEEMLSRIGEILKTRISAIGDAYRVSLYTFAALVPEMSGDPARELGETLRADIAGYTFRRGDRQFNATASIALMEINEWTEGVDTLTDASHKLLLEASVAGGNRVVVFRAEDARLSQRRNDQEWIEWLMPRFERKLIHLVSQSIVPAGKADTSRPWVEVFVRVEEDDGHWLPPGAFLPALRRNRLTSKLDLWVLEQGLRSIETNHTLFDKYAGLSINLDNASVVSEDFRRGAIELLEKSFGAGVQICFEIEESCVANRTQEVVELIDALKPFGVRFVLDHCRGAATVGLLRKVPVDFVKFHESLVRRTMSDPVDRAELEWLNQAAHLLSRKTVASHIESKELHELMTRIGIDYVQGLAIDQLGPLLL